MSLTLCFLLKMRVFFESVLLIIVNVMPPPLVTSCLLLLLYDDVSQPHVWPVPYF